MTKTTQLDELDRKIIDVLAKDGRVSNRQIAAMLGVTEGTIRGRIKRLEQENCIRFTAVTGKEYLGSPKTVLIGVQVVHGELKALCRKIADMPEVRSVIVMFGRYDILAIGLFNSLDEVFEIANNRILALPGVRHVETSVAAETIKYDYRAAKITPGRKVSK